MNLILEAYARGWLTENLRQLTDEQIEVFKRMYSHLDLSADIDAVVKAMPASKLDWAMMQVERTVQKNVAAAEPSNA